MTQFAPGEIYYGSLSIAHSSFPVRCVKRTDKSAWFEHVTMPEGYKGPKRAKIHSYKDSESASAWGWYISSTTLDKDPSSMYDPYTI